MTNETNKSIQWVEAVSRVSDLTPYERNPRQISDIQYKKLKDSLEQDGYHTRIKATGDGRVIGGHQRLRAMKELGYTEIIILIPDRQLTDEQFKRIMLRDNVNNGEWDMEMLANDFDLEELRSFGLDEVMNVPPWDEEDKSHEDGVSRVCCPGCGEVFAIKGNQAQ